jgi:hypothetical protein
MRHQNSKNAMKQQETRKSKVLAAAIVLTGVAALVAGCVERRVVYVPTYQVPPGYPPPPASTYHPQTVYPSPPAPATGSTSNSAPGAAAPAPQQSAPGGPAMAPAVPPPSPQVEVMPAAPGPDYVWAPGYWGWNGGWVWIGGGWIVRPHPGAIWVGGHWAWRGRGYVWVGGHWR